MKSLTTVIVILIGTAIVAVLMSPRSSTATAIRSLAGFFQRQVLTIMAPVRSM